MQVLEAGPEIETTESDTELNGVPVSPVKTIQRRPGRQPLSVPIGHWQSGLYFARLEAPDGRVGFAPFVVRPGRIGVARVAVVLPTLTWQAYNFRDDDGDGRADSWYAGKRLNTVRLGRAFLDRGVPYGLRFHLGFLHWLALDGQTRRRPVAVGPRARLERPTRFAARTTSSSSQGTTST